MKDLGTTDVILRIKIIYSEEGIGLSQSHYVESMLRKYDYYDLPELSVIYDYNKKLRPNIGRLVE